jgi:AcrR family transcriptional regulator
MQPIASDDAVEAVGATPKPPAHRPSRRHLIVQAAITVFAQKGFTDASIQDIADEASVVPTAVYYHFSGKDELFEVALGKVIGEIDAVVEEARAQHGTVTGDTLPAVIGAVWDWVEAHPDEARVVYIHLPGATLQARVLRQEFEDQHIQRAFDYLQRGDDQSGRRSSEAEVAASSLAIRTLMTLLMSIHPLRLEDGPLSKRSSRGLLQGLEEVAARIIGVPAAGG